MSVRKALICTAGVCLSAYVLLHLFNDLSNNNLVYLALQSTTTSDLENLTADSTPRDLFHSQDLAAEATWSDKWPHVNLRNCSRIQFMDRGINSPDPKTRHVYRRTGIVSAPGHGNTWTRHLIEQATGLWTGSVFDDRSLYGGGFEGEIINCLLNSTVAIKDHSLYAKRCTFERVIIVVRNLYFGSLAEFNRMRGNGHVKSADIALFNSTAWKDYTRKSTNWLSTQILQMITKYVQGGDKLNMDVNPFVSNPNHWKNLLFVSYERLKRDPVKEAARIVEFLGLPVFRRHCVEMDIDGHFKRPDSGIPIGCFYQDPEVKESMRKAILYLSKTAEQRGVGNITSEFAFTDIVSRTDCPF